MSNPQQLRPDIVVLSDAETLRVRKFVASCILVKEAKRRLGMADSVIAAARDFGRMQRSTRTRLLAALDREGA